MVLQHLASLRPTLFLNNFCGYASFKYNRNKQKLHSNNFDFIVAFIVIVIFTLLTAYFGYYIAQELNPSDASSSCFTNLAWTFKTNFELYVGLLIIVMIYYDFLSKRKAVLNIHYEFMEVDEMLERELQVSVKLPQVRRSVASYLLIFVLFNLVEVVTIVFLYYLGFDDWYEYLEHLFAFAIAALMSVKVYHLCSLLVALKARYQSLSSLLRDRCSSYLSPSDPAPLDDKQMRYLLRVHDKLCDIVDNINSIFSKFIFSFFMYYFIIVSVVLFFSCKILMIAPKVEGLYFFRAYFYVVVGVVWVQVLQMFLQVATVVYAAHGVSAEADEATILAHKAAGLFDQEPIRNKLQVFLMALINRKPKITAFHCYDIEPGLIIGMIGVIFTYVIILIQFELTDGVGCKAFLEDLIGVDDKTLEFLVSLNETQLDIFFQVLNKMRVHPNLNVTEVYQDFLDA